MKIYHEVNIKRGIYDNWDLVGKKRLKVGINVKIIYYKSFRIKYFILQNKIYKLVLATHQIMFL